MGATPAGLRLVLEPAADRSARDLGDLLEVAGAVRRLVAATRPLDGADLQPAHADPDRRVDLDELESRIDAAQRALEAARDTLGALLDDPSPTVGAMRRALVTAAGFGIATGLAPLAGGDADVVPAASAGFVSASAVFADATRRLGDAERERPAPEDEPEAARRDRLLRRVRGVFGPGFVAVPVFRAGTAADLEAGHRSAALLADDPLAPYTWLTRLERVRPALERFTMPYTLAGALGSGAGLDLSVAHVPHAGDRPWIGGPFDDVDGTAPDALVSIVLQGATDVDLAAPLAGLLVDEWTEVVPRGTETAGLAFCYDPPDAMAPQAVLVAVPPDPAAPWTVGALNRVLLETLDLAHLRATGPESVDAVGHYLPATMLAFNIDGDVVSTDPTALIGAPQA
jgi:hypothetical protein